jgi:hypothetical protein
MMEGKAASGFDAHQGPSHQSRFQLLHLERCTFVLGCWLERGKADCEFVYVETDSFD